MKFKMVADIKFDADDLQDAFFKLKHHFWALQEGEESNLITEGSIEIMEETRENT